MKRGLALLSFAPLLATTVAMADSNGLIDREQGSSVNEDTADLVALRAPHNDIIRPMYPSPHSNAASSNVIFMNKCTGGCVVSPGQDDSRTNKSSIVSRSGTLPAFPYSADVWNQVMACMRQTFGPFNVVVTDVDPGTAEHLEVLVGTSPQSLGFDSRTGGVAPFACETYVPNALVFDFSGIWGQGTACDATCIQNVCSTAAQEIAHTWALDHVTDPNDPMTYYGQGSTVWKKYGNMNSPCGSDCVSGQGPMGETCSGPNNQSHACSCTGQATQNDYQAVAALFGTAAPTPPMVKITDPANGAQVNPGFPIHSEVTDTDGVAKVELRIDNNLISTSTSGPFAFNGPATLGDGTHRVEITGYDAFNTPAKAFIDVIIGKPCEKPGDCPVNTDTCVGGRCVPGSGVAGGLGSACTDNSQCLDGQCASGNQGEVCVVACSTGECPSGFGCVMAQGAAAGVCYPGFDDGSGGGCSTSGGSIGLGLGFAALIATRRRRRR